MKEEKTHKMYINAIWINWVSFLVVVDFLLSKDSIKMCVDISVNQIRRLCCHYPFHQVPPSPAFTQRT